MKNQKNFKNKKINFKEDDNAYNKLSSLTFNSKEKRNFRKKNFDIEKQNGFKSKNKRNKKDKVFNLYDIPSTTKTNSKKPKIKIYKKKNSQYSITIF